MREKAQVLAAVVLVLCVGLACKRRGSLSSSSSSSSSSYDSGTNTQTFTTKNGLVTAHYPEEFVARNVDNDTISMRKRVADKSEEIVQVAAVVNPISDDVDELGRVLIQSMIKDLDSYGDKWIETSRDHTTCYKSITGLSVKGYFMAKGVTKTNVTFCIFMQSKHGYMLKSIIADKHDATERATIDSILDATELK
jgi:hypothetical protein